MGAEKLRKAQGQWSKAESQKGSDLDSQLLEQGYHQRSGDPSKSAQKGNTSEKLNSDSSQYRQPKSN